MPTAFDADFPPKQGLYDPSLERDSCGAGLIADLRGERSHQLVADALALLENLRHRGAQGEDPLTGDGAGILIGIPHELLADEFPGLPPAGEYAVLSAFAPVDEKLREEARQSVTIACARNGFEIMHWREIPVRLEHAGPSARERAPRFLQLIVRAPATVRGDALERLCIRTRRQAEKLTRDAIGNAAYVSSFSSRTVIYKGMLLPEQLPHFFPDLTDPRTRSAFALVHSRFSTNTFPSWPLAHPYRLLCHNGEINTLRGNLNWMTAREERIAREDAAIRDESPIVRAGQSDSASLDNALDFLVSRGRKIEEALMALVPEPFDDLPENSASRLFYEAHERALEPWDGPALLCFTDGVKIGATLDRNGLRPCRYLITTDDRLIAASELGALPVSPDRILTQGRLGPGQMLLADLSDGTVLENARPEIARRWKERGDEPVRATSFAAGATSSAPLATPIARAWRTHGYTREEIESVILPTGATGDEPISSMGNDTPIAALSDRAPSLFRYFRQLFAQVTNPPIDPIREQRVMSLATLLGPKADAVTLAARGPLLKLKQPILSDADLDRIAAAGSHRIETFFETLPTPGAALARALDSLIREAVSAIDAGATRLILSDRRASAGQATQNDESTPIPSLLAVAAVHHGLIRAGRRLEASLIVESGEPRDVHHMACLLGYGAEAINPWLALATLPTDDARAAYIKACGKGLLKILSKMGISSLQSYVGAQVFEALGLSQELVDKYFTGTLSRIGGIGLEEIAEDALLRHRLALETATGSSLEYGGDIHYRFDGEKHAWNPETIARLQHAARKNDPRSFREFSATVDTQGAATTLRGLLDFAFPETSVPLDEVEPASSIVKRFTTGAMSLGAISPEAHETLALAMNRIGAKSNSGEGGEDPARFIRDPSGELKSSAIKQVASARFGVTIHYLTNATEIQIKVAQGAKPGEGGQLPGHKVDENIARLRHSVPGVQLISPPPHHDIYSIEDLAQLIFDLKNANPYAEVSVKLVSEAGVGTVAAGVAKAHANKILISGDSGGTGASPLSSIKYAGLPWELGLAETQQTLLLNGLRDRVRVEVDGQMKTGRDVVVAALLGADEFGFATAPLIVEGCIMMRKCHLNTCPVGIATQDESLRRKFTGQPEHVINYFFFVAEEARELMARLGARTLDELVGRVDLLKKRDGLTGRAALLEIDRLTRLPHGIRRSQASPKSGAPVPDARIEETYDASMLGMLAESIRNGTSTLVTSAINNTHRSVGTRISHELTRIHGDAGLADGLIRIELSGVAGQSLGAFLAPGIDIRVEGGANDYVGKGLSGGRIVLVAPKGAKYDAHNAVIGGNTALYGATSGQLLVAGRMGERFAVRNSGAVAVVEGIGDHGCEYMTGGTVIVLGSTGRNFGAGMSGGIAFVHDPSHEFDSRCNKAMVELSRVSNESDVELLTKWVSIHHLLTGSPTSARILEALDPSEFVRVLPIEYARAMAARAAREEAAGERLAHV